MKLEISKIKPSPFQPRLEFDLEDLKGSIIKDGILVPLTVRKLKDEHYELIDGERRLRLAKELGYGSVPCEVIEVDDETADRMVWKVNTLRKDYRPKEKALHYKHHQEQGMSLRGIARDHDADPQMVKAYLNVLNLPDKYQNLVWNREIGIGVIREMERMFNGGVEYSTQVYELLDRVITEKHFGLMEVRKTLRPYLEERDRKTKEAGRELAKTIDPEIQIETPEDYEKAADALKREAKKKREEAMTPEEKAKIEADKQTKKIQQEQKQEETARLKKERAEQLKQEKEEEIQKRAVKEAKKLKKEELLKDESFIKEVYSGFEILKQKELSSQSKEQIYVPLPKGKYRTITIDPAWPMPKILRKIRPNQFILDYPPMTLEEIEALPISKLAFEDGCHIYLWTTHKFLPVAFKILDAWGAKYECLLTWVKNVGITPFSWMYSTEPVLFGRIGSLDLLKKGERLDFKGKVREHSRKPDEFYNLVKEVSPEPRIDMFSREKREGFEQYGNETDKFSSKQATIIGADTL